MRFLRQLRRDITGRQVAQVNDVTARSLTAFGSPDL